MVYQAFNLDPIDKHYCIPAGRSSKFIGLSEFCMANRLATFFGYCKMPWVHYRQNSIVEISTILRYNSNEKHFRSNRKI